VNSNEKKVQGPLTFDLEKLPLTLKENLKTTGQISIRVYRVMRLS